MEKQKKREKEELCRFRKYVEDRIGRLVKDENRKFMQFDSMTEVYHTVV